MKKLRIIILIIVSSVLFSGSSYENFLDKQMYSAKKSGFMNEIPKDAEILLNSAGIEDFDYESISSLSVKDVAELFLNGFIINIKEPFESIFIITAVSILTSVIKSFSEDFSLSGKIINIVTTLVTSSVFLVPVKKLISVSAGIIEECSNFMLAFIPVYSSAVAASGYISSAAGFRTIMMGTVTIISKIAANIISPLLCIYLALCIASAVSDFDISSIAKSVKNSAIWILSFIMTVFSGIMGLGTILSTSVDGSVSKTAKFFIGSFIPVVGSAVSDSFSTVKSCLSVTKNFLGIYAIIVIAAIFIPPIISLFSWKICFSVSSGISLISGNKTLSSLISSVASVLGIIMALVVITAVMFIFSVTIMLLTGGGL